MGGLSRHRTVLDRLRDKGNADVVAVNAGNNVNTNPNASSMRKLELILKVMDLMDMDMVAVGSGEMNLGPERLADAAALSKAPLVCTNYLSPQEGFSPLPWTMVERGGRKILLTCLVAPSEVREQYRPLLTDPVPALRKVIDSTEFDFLITVMHANLRTCKEWIAQLPEINLIISGTDRDRFLNMGSTILAANNNEGKNINWVDATIRDGQYDFSRPEKLILSTGFAKDPTVEEMVEKFKAWQDGQVDFENRLKVISRWARMGVEVFAGDMACGWCHAYEHKEWSQTAHARALETLVEENREEDLACVGCHVTGMNDNRALNGYSTKNTEMTDVQCEACHGPGGTHALDPATYSVPVARPGQETCMSCHTPEWSPDFIFFLDRYKGVH